MKHYFDYYLTMLAPITWGTTYLVTTEYLPAGYPITMAMLRALPAGLLILALYRKRPYGNQWLKIFALGGLNFTVFWICLFISAYRLPGGIAAILTATQPLIVIGLSVPILQGALSPRAIGAACAGLLGVSLLVLQSSITLDFIGISAALLAAASMALGTVLSKKWRGNESLIVFTGWQLTAGGILLLPVTLLFEPNFPVLTAQNIAGITWLSLVGALLTYLLWFNGIEKLDPATTSILGFLSPVTAIVLGWSVLGQDLNPVQLLGIVIIALSVISVTFGKEKTIDI